MNLIITKSGINRMRAAILNKYGTQLKIMTYCLLSRRLRIGMGYIYVIVTFDYTNSLRYITAQFTNAGYSCALIDTSDCFDPMDAEAADVELNRVLWIWH